MTASLRESSSSSCSRRICSFENWTYCSSSRTRGFSDSAAINCRTRASRSSPIVRTCFSRSAIWKSNVSILRCDSPMCEFYVWRSMSYRFKRSIVRAKSFFCWVSRSFSAVSLSTSSSNFFTSPSLRERLTVSSTWACASCYRKSEIVRSFSASNCDNVWISARA